MATSRSLFHPRDGVAPRPVLLNPVLSSLRIPDVKDELLLHTLPLFVNPDTDTVNRTPPACVWNGGKACKCTECARLIACEHCTYSCGEACTSPPPCARAARRATGLATNPQE